jgi:hypothetical protein
MKHRSPLITLSVVVVWFVVMLVVNLVVHPSHGSSAAEPNTTLPPNPSTSAAASASPSATPVPPPSQTPTATKPAKQREDSYPDKVVYAGRTSDGSLALAIAVLNGKAAAYLCDGRQVEAWLRGETDEDELSLTSRAGAKVEAKLKGKHLKGSIELSRHRFTFSITEATKPAGLYRARGSKTTIGWIVLPNGSQVGVATDSDGNSAPAPKLDPNSGQVGANGEELTAEPVTGDTDI